MHVVITKQTVQYVHKQYCLFMAERNSFLTQSSNIAKFVEVLAVVPLPGWKLSAKVIPNC